MSNLKNKLELAFDSKFEEDTMYLKGFEFFKIEIKKEEIYIKKIKTEYIHNFENGKIKYVKFKGHCP